MLHEKHAVKTSYLINIALILEYEYESHTKMFYDCEARSYGRNMAFLIYDLETEYWYP